MAGIIRELLNKEHSAKNRKQILEFLNDRMRIIPFILLKDEEVLKTLENIFKEEVSFNYVHHYPISPSTKIPIPSLEMLPPREPIPRVRINL